jgi:hypothetical protein
MSEFRIGSAIVHRDGAALIVHCPALRNGGASLMLAAFGAACSVIAMASFLGLAGASGTAGSGLLALAFAGVFVLPLLGIGGLFIAIALWNACNALTAATAGGELRVERRWCGMLLSRKSVPVAAIEQIDCAREARFKGLAGGARYYRLIAQTNAGALVLADHLRGDRDETEKARQLFIEAMGRSELAASGRRDDRAAAEAAAETA